MRMRMRMRMRIRMRMTTKRPFLSSIQSKLNSSTRLQMLNYWQAMFFKSGFA